MRISMTMSMLAALTIAGTGCEDGGGQKAAEFGVTDPNKSALVIQDHSENFFITATSYANTETGGLGQNGAIADNKSATYTIEPGDYRLVVDARWESLNITTNILITTNSLKFADEKVSASFTVQAGDAIVYNLSGGAIYESLGKYSAPTLELQ